MSISDDIRQLAREGLAVADIARRLGIRYQHAYGVLRKGGSLQVTEAPPSSKRPQTPKPSLSAQDLLKGGFERSGRWVLSEAGVLVIDGCVPKKVGVYAFGEEERILYVGVATIGVAKRLYFYGKPGVTQKTSQRLNSILRERLLTVPHVDIYTASPPDLEWNGLPVHGSAGLELGLIKKFDLPWNIRSANG